jgi:hypothetical protein
MFPNCSVPSGFPTKIVCAVLISHYFENIKVSDSWFLHRFLTGHNTALKAVRHNFRYIVFILNSFMNFQYHVFALMFFHLNHNANERKDTTKGPIGVFNFRRARY